MHNFHFDLQLSERIFHKAQISVYAYIGEVEFMCTEEFEEFLEPTTCVTVKPCHLHMSPVVSTPVPTDNVQLRHSYRLAVVHDPCCTSTSDVEFMCSEEFDDFPRPTSCISSIIFFAPAQKHKIGNISTLSGFFGPMNFRKKKKLSTFMY